MREVVLVYERDLINDVVYDYYDSFIPWMMIVDLLNERNR